MTIQNQLKLLPLMEIKVRREVRQRTDLTPASVYELALAIAANGLLQNIGVDYEHNIVFGERRYTAFLLLHQIATDIKPTGVSEDQWVELQRAIQLADSPYNNYSKIPARLIKSESTLSLGAIEFIENVQRQDLPWQDKARAAHLLHNQAVEEQKARNEAVTESADVLNWTDTQTARLLGISKAYFSQLVNPLRELAVATPATREKIKEAIETSPTAQSAVNATKTIKERHGEVLTTDNSLGAGLRRMQLSVAQPDKEEEEEEDTPLSLGERSIFCADFHEWAATYTGEPFNFIHCDFPYGIDFNKSAGQSTSAATKSVGQYDDGENIYWDLLTTLLLNRERLIAPSAHIMFWYSQNFDDETRAKIMKVWPDAVISKFRLIWHCSDNSGLCPAPQYEGRRTYETAFHITLGKRKIASPVALSFASPRGEDKIHRSQKHLPVLAHFFKQFVDNSTRMLDPTCGSGTSVITAHKLGAKKIVGLERDAEMRELAVKLFDKEAK